MQENDVEALNSYRKCAENEREIIITFLSANDSDPMAYILIIIIQLMT